MGSRTSEQHGQLLRELNEERLAALTRIAGTLDGLIEQLKALRERLATTSAPVHARDIALYHELRNRARKYRWYLEVQREALGLRQHHILDEMYQIPAPLDGDAARA